MPTTIHNPAQSPDAATLALAALGWILQEEARAERFLSLTGLDPDGLRARLGDKALQLSVLEFLANHEPDMLRCSEALAVSPEELAGAGKELAR
jgi:hypothetical protein